MDIKDFKDKKMYRLADDVKNPTPDRRVTGDWRKKPVIPEGKLFFFRVGKPGVTFGYNRLEPMVGYSTKDVALDDRLFLAMLPYLRLVDDNLETVLMRYNITEADVLRFLVKVNHTSIGFIDGFGQDVVKMLDAEEV